jgi:pimeloyl-ACP methyl ester carboxylesterase
VRVAVKRWFLLCMMLALIISATSSHLRADEIWQRLPPPRSLPEPTSSGYAWVNGVQLYYASFGSGEPLLLLHGPLGNADYWGNQVRAFARQYRVIILDSRGHGRSTRDARLFSYHLLADDVLALLDLLQIDRVAVVGWSDGGNIALQLAITHPERLSKAFIFDANFNPSGMRSDVDQSDTFVRYVDLAGQDYLRLSSTPGDYDLFFHAVNFLWGAEPDFTPAQLGSIRLPILIAAGDHDEVVKQAHTEALARLIPGARLVLLPKASFFAMWQQPAAFNRAVLDFLAGAR